MSPKNKLRVLEMTVFRWLVLLIILTVSFQSLACDCEAMKKQKYCRSPSCIKFCNLESFFEDIHKSLFKKCLPGKEIKKEFRKRQLSVVNISSFLKKIKREIQQLERKEQKILKTNCPGCHLFPELKVRFKVESSQNVCPEKYIKEYNYEKSLNGKITNSGCDKAKLNKGLEDYMQSLLRKNASQEAKHLWRVCPDPCSFDTGFSVRINEAECIGNISVTVLCTNPNRGFVGPIYDALVEYKKGLQCKK